MKSAYGFFCLLSIIIIHLFIAFSETNAAQHDDNGVYIVYMGASSSRNDHSQLLSSLIRRKKDAVKHNYSNGFSGFAARLSKQEAMEMAGKHGVVSVFPDPILRLHTTHSWDFLKYQTAVKIDLRPRFSSGLLSSGADTIIGILDTGIWPESESFNDKDIGPVPSQWKGKCMEGTNFTASNCNRKLIGARYYADPSEEGSGPRDENGHGTHVASTAAGAPVPGASYYALANGTATGGSPGSRIAMYRVCTQVGCRGSDILKAFDDAIGDGVDVLSLSLGGSPGSDPPFDTDPIALRAFHATERGITVVCSAGNDGPTGETVVNIAPWILTVAATTIDRDFQVDITLGGGKTIKGGGINLGRPEKSHMYPLIYGGSAKADSANVVEARDCNPGSLDDNKVKGKILLCENKYEEYSAREKEISLRTQGGIGLILIDDNARSVASFYGSFPMGAVTSSDGAEILSYINSTSNPIATISSTVTITDYKPAPSVAYFSSRGPAWNTKNILKPDITAPGVDILAAWPANDTRVAIAGKDPPLFNVLSGTSMSCPHVSGIAAAVKSQNPSFTPSAIRSAIMTTAVQTDNLKAPITTNSGSVATPYDIGAGEVNPSQTLTPGLIYETELVEYLNFLCDQGYDASKIKLISQTAPASFSCPDNTTTSDLTTNMNYPSIAASGFATTKNKTVKRTVKNVGEDEASYSVVIESPKEVEVRVEPSKLRFTKKNEKMSFQVSFTVKSSLKGELFGSITWTSGKYYVRSPFVVSN